MNAMVNLWYTRIVTLKISKLPNVPERYYDGVSVKLAENSFDGNGNKIEQSA